MRTVFYGDQADRSDQSDQDHASSPPEIKEAERHRLALEREGLADMISTFDPALAERVAACGTQLNFDVYEHRKTRENSRVLAHADFCHTRKWCPTCAAFYSRQVAADFLGRLAAMQRKRKADHLSPYRAILLTLTVKNCRCDELRETLKAMSRAWDRMVKYREFKRAIVGGWLRGVEYLGDETREGEAHPHYHVLCIVTSTYFSDNYLSQSRWTELWQKAARLDYVPVVHVERIKPRLKTVVDGNGKAFERVQTAASAAAAEVCKYVIAPASVKRLSDVDFQTLYQQAKGGRQFLMGGLLKDTPPDPPEELDPDEWQFIAHELWRWGAHQYVLKERTDLTEEQREQWTARAKNENEDEEEDEED